MKDQLINIVSDALLSNHEINKINVFVNNFDFLDEQKKSPMFFLCIGAPRKIKVFVYS